MKKALFLFLFFFFLPVSSVFAEISLRCEVDKKNISTDDQLAYKLIVSSSEKNIPAPKSPVFQGFGILSQAQSSTVIFGKGDVKTVLVYTYILAPFKPGKFKIEPATVTLKDKTYATQEIEIEVKQGKNIPDDQPQEQPMPLPEDVSPDSGEPQVTL